VASSRQLAEATRLERKHVRHAIETLTQRCLLATRKGSGKQPSAYLLNFMGTVQLPSGVLRTPLQQTALPLEGSQGPHTHEPLGLVEGSSRPHPSEPRGPLDIDTPDIEPSALDRVLKARPRQFQHAELAQVRGYAYKWLLMQRGQQHAQPPDEHVCARLIAAAGGAGAACDWIRDHLQDHQSETCEYLVVSMLQKIHGIAPPTVARRRAQLRAVAKAAPGADASLASKIADLARKKAMR